MNTHPPRTWFFATALGVLACGLVWIAGSAWAREWTDSTGKFKIEAEFERVSEGKVYLRGTDGKPLKKPIPLDKLSEADREFVKSLTARKKTPAKANSKTKAEPDKDAAKPVNAKARATEAKATGKVDVAGSPTKVVKWDLAGLRECRYKTQLTLKLGGHATIVMGMDLKLNTATVKDDGMAMVKLTSHKIKCSYDSPTVKGSYDGSQKQQQRERPTEGPEHDVGSALYVASWIPGMFGMSPNGSIQQNGQSEFLKLEVAHPEAVQITNVLNSQALMRLFVTCIGPLPADPLVEGADLTWTQDWTSPLTAPDRMPPSVKALWSYQGRTKDGDKLTCEFPAPGTAASPSGLAGTQTIVFDRNSGRMHSAKLEFGQKVQIAEQGAQGLPVKVTYDVTFLKAAPAPRTP